MNKNTISLHLNVVHTTKLDDLRAQIGVTDYCEALNHALSVLAWAVREVAAGHKIGSMDEKGSFRKVEMKWMAAVPRKLFKGIP